MSLLCYSIYGGLDLSCTHAMNLVSLYKYNILIYNTYMYSMICIDKFTGGNIILQRDQV